MSVIQEKGIVQRKVLVTNKAKARVNPMHHTGLEELVRQRRHLCHRVSSIVFISVDAMQNLTMRGRKDIYAALYDLSKRFWKTTLLVKFLGCFVLDKNSANRAP